MLITAIEPRRRSLCEVYIDGESAGLLDLETLERLHVKMGQELTDDDWSYYCAESDRTRARSYALWLLSRRAMTQSSSTSTKPDSWSANSRPMPELAPVTIAMFI